MRQFFLTICILSSALSYSFGQSSKKTKSFVGMLEYKITVRDTSLKELIPDNRMIVYSNDTIARVENFTDHLGQQVAIKHMLLGKSYLLLETDFGKFALQMDETKTQEKARENAENDSTNQSKPEFEFKKKCGKRSLLGRKMNRVIVSHPDFEEPIEFLYMKNHSKQLVDAYPEINGIPVKYSVLTPDAILDYELVKINEYNPDRNLFGIPTDFERVSFDEFMDKLVESKEKSLGE